MKAPSSPQESAMSQRLQLTKETLRALVDDRLTTVWGGGRGVAIPLTDECVETSTCPFSATCSTTNPHTKNCVTTNSRSIP
jgi:hypothetical protein